jgi:hypothetical protein
MMELPKRRNKWLAKAAACSKHQHGYGPIDIGFGVAYWNSICIADGDDDAYDAPQIEGFCTDSSIDTQ